MADGCILEYRNRKTGKLKAMALQLSLAYKDNDHVIRFLRDIGSDAPLKNPTVRLNGKEFITSKTVICNTKMCRDLINLNCTPRKTLTLEYPDDKIPKEYVKDFIRGYFDGDGSVSFSEYDCFSKQKNKQIHIYNFGVNILGTKDFLEAIKIFIDENNITSYLRNYKPNIYELRIQGCKNIYAFYKYIYFNSTLYLDRKYEVFLKGFNHYDLAY